MEPKMSEVSEVVQIDTLKRRMVACASLLDQIGIKGVRLLSCWLHMESGLDVLILVVQVISECSNPRGEI